MKIRANSHCATCYALRWQDARYFGGMREAVLARDGRACQVCGTSSRRKRFLLVHHRVPGKSSLSTMIALCRACHNRVHHTRVALAGYATLTAHALARTAPHRT